MTTLEMKDYYASVTGQELANTSTNAATGQPCNSTPHTVLLVQAAVRGSLSYTL